MPLRLIAFAWLVASVAGCSATDPLERQGVAFQVPVGWVQVPRATWPVTGVPLGAWSGPSGASLVVFRSLPDPDATAEGLAAGLVNRLENFPGLRVLSSGTETIAGVPAARVEVSAPGFGDALAPTGLGAPIALAGKALRPTRRVVIVVPRRDDLITLLWHAPEENAGALAGFVRDVLKSCAIRQDRSAAISY